MAERRFLVYGSGAGRKFYEVTIDGASVTYRYGPVGRQGRTLNNSFASVAAAQAAAHGKIREKIRDGYAEVGGAQAGSPTPSIRGASVGGVGGVGRAPSPPRGPMGGTAPVLWTFSTGARAFGIFIDRERCWVGNEHGRVFALDHDGALHQEFSLPRGVKCIVSDGDWLYAGCDDGSVYDLNGKVPYVAYEIDRDESADIYWLDIFDGVLAVSDARGRVSVFNHEDESQWSGASRGTGGWMVRTDEIGLYHGHAKGLTMYDWEDGSELWHRSVSGAIFFGWQEESTLYVATSARKVYRFSKAGEELGVFSCDSTVFSCAAAEDGRYIFAGDNRGMIYCFKPNGERLWKLQSGCGSAFSMQYLDQRLYLVTTRGQIAVIDASEAAIRDASRGVLPTPRSMSATAAPSRSAARIDDHTETTTDVGGGVVVECFKEGGRLRVRAVSAGYNRDWKVQFPRNIRAEGARFVVDEVREAARGGFYRAYGNIRRLVR